MRSKEQLISVKHKFSGCNSRVMRAKVHGIHQNFILERWMPKQKNKKKTVGFRM
jgi:hypothetical protein